jgi:hypothetical protein
MVKRGGFFSFCNVNTCVRITDHVKPIYRVEPQEDHISHVSLFPATVQLGMYVFLAMLMYINLYNVLPN